MIENHHYQLRQSQILLGYLLCLCLTLFFLSILYFRGWLQFGLISLVSIYLYIKIDRYRSSFRQVSTTLILNSITNEIQIKQPHLDKKFNDFKLYSNRWFLILHLRREDCSRHFVLLSDKFSSMTEYLSFRHQIKRMIQTQDVYWSRCSSSRSINSD